MTFEPGSPEVDGFLSDAGYETRLSPLRIEGSNRRYYRAVSKERQDSAVLCIQAPFVPEGDDFLLLQGFLDGNGIPVPNILQQDAGMGLMLLEDGGIELDAWARTATDDQMDLLLDRVLDSLVALQTLSIESPVSRRSFDRDKLYWEMEFLFERVERIMVQHGFQIYMAFEFKMFLMEMCEALGGQQPQVFVHRDFHSRNILVSESADNPGFLFIDFQDARKGNVFYDVASFLFDPYLDYGQERRNRLIQTFMDKAKLDKGRGILYLQALQRILKALGSYLYLGLEQGKTEYLECIPPALDRLETCMHLGRFPDSIFLFLLDCRKKLLPALNL
jgi:aminoglycoside/choline kinase family phosphotransferase